MLCITPQTVEAFNSRLIFEPRIITKISYNNATNLTDISPAVHYASLVGNGEVLPKYNDFFISNMQYKAISKSLCKPSKESLVFGSYLNRFFLDNGITIKSALPIPEGGIEFEFIHNSCFYNITLDNQNEASFYVERPNTKPEGWDFDFNELRNRIVKEFV